PDQAQPKAPSDDISIHDQWVARFQFLWGHAILAQAEWESDNSPREPLPRPLHSPRKRRVTEYAASPSSSDAESVLEDAEYHFTQGARHLPHPNSFPPTEKPPLYLARTRTLLNAALPFFQFALDPILGWENHEVWDTWVIDLLEGENEATIDEPGLLHAVNILRGKAWFSLGDMYVQQCESGLEAGDEAVWESNELTTAKGHFTKALEVLQKAYEQMKGQKSVADKGPVPQRDVVLDFLEYELNGFLGETLLNLGNLTKDGQERTAIYDQAKQYGINLDAMDEDKDEADNDEHDKSDDAE
ncbi:hypothetical protein FRB99_003206, partial [Tulasnella sp. 403]